MLPDYIHITARLADLKIVLFYSIRTDLTLVLRGVKARLYPPIRPVAVSHRIEQKSISNTNYVRAIESNRSEILISASTE